VDALVKKAKRITAIRESGPRRKRKGDLGVPWGRPVDKWRGLDGSLAKGLGEKGSARLKKKVMTDKSRVMVIYYGGRKIGGGGLKGGEGQGGFWGCARKSG